jgi:hypothetical protein
MTTKRLLIIGVALALAGCDGEATPTDYHMAGMLAEDNSRSGAIARSGLLDGYLSVAEANAMWEAYHAERDTREAQQKAEVIQRWSQPTHKGREP